MSTVPLTDQNEEKAQEGILAELMGRWLVPVVLASVLGAGLGFLYVRQMPRIYEAKTSVLAEINARQVLKEAESQEDNRRNYSVFNSREFFATQKQVLKSEDLARRVAVALDLVNRKAWVQALGKIKEDQDLDRRTVTVLVGGLTVSRERFARSIDLRFRHRNPALAAEIVNGFAEEYVRRAATQRTAAESTAHRYLEAEEKRLTTELDRVETSISSFREDNGILSKDIENSRTLQWESLSRLNSALDMTSIRRIELQERVRSFEGLVGGGRVAAVIADSKGGNAPLLVVRQNLAQARALLAREKANYNANHPTIRELENKVTAHLAEQRTLVDDHLAHLVGQRMSLEREEAGVRTRIANAKAAVIRLSGLTLDYERLVGERDGLNKLRESVRQQLLATGMALRLDNNNVEVLDRAAIPTVPVGPITILFVCMGAALALILTAGLALVVELTHTTLQGVDQAERLSSAPCLGVVHMLRKPSDPPELTVGLQPRSTLAEQYRSLRSNLLFMNVDKPLRAISVSSPAPADGKTFTAVSVGIALAQSESRVLLVDTDLRRGRLHRIFGVKGDAGMADLLLKTATHDQVCKPTAIENLDILPSGKHPPNPAELLHSATFREVRDELLTHYDMIVFDTPPVNLVTDAVVLGNQTDGLLLVVRHKQTAKAELRHCTQKLAQGKVNVLGLVFNAHVQASGLYSYYYRYGYGRYGGYYGTYGRYGAYSPEKRYGIEEV